MGILPAKAMSWKFESLDITWAEKVICPFKVFVYHTKNKLPNILDCICYWSTFFEMSPVTKILGGSKINFSYA